MIILASHIMTISPCSTSYDTGQEREKLQKFDYLDNEKSILGYLNSILHNDLKAVFW